MSKKQTVFFETEVNPRGRGVTFVAINSDASIPYVWATYFCTDRNQIPSSVRDSSNILVVPRGEALSKYDFQNRNDGHFGFDQVLELKNNDKYAGDADKVMLIWNKYQVLPAEQYRSAHFDNERTDIAICQDPNVQLKQLGENRALIYNFSSNSGSGSSGRK